VRWQIVEEGGKFGSCLIAKPQKSRRADAEAALARFEGCYTLDWSAEIASRRALRGDVGQPFARLDRAYQQHEAALVGIPSVHNNADFRNLYGDPRQMPFQHNLKFPE
jgi:hypothetical protein